MTMPPKLLRTSASNEKFWDGQPKGEDGGVSFGKEDTGDTEASASQKRKKKREKSIAPATTLQPEIVKSNQEKEARPGGQAKVENEPPRFPLEEGVRTR